MVLVFGGTTEGRKAVEVLEEAGSLYYYSTLSDGQQIELVNGVHLTGPMDVAQMTDCCRQHNIRLIVDAAHPFAEELHRNLLFVARQIDVPVIRYDRIYPPHTDDVVWCKDYQDAMAKLEAEGIDRLLALTGVNNIGTLRPYWEHHECWFRILNRGVSQTLARKAAFPEDHLVYYGEDDTRQLLEHLHPQAILTKESGQSGGFTEKVEAAKAAGVKVFVIERPEYPQQEQTAYVNGPHGLRRAVEQLLPEFFPLHSGLTTGTCATAAAIAATLQYIHSSFFTLHSSLLTPNSSLFTKVPVILPNGETIHVPVGYGEDYAFCIKEAGDDPDVTNGLEIRVKVEPAAQFQIIGGEGVGHFTLPGFDYPPGEPAINKGPREMIRQNVMAVINSSLITYHSSLLTYHSSFLISHFSFRPKAALTPHLSLLISVPQGEEIARRTFNPRLGIEGGISIIGVSGIVKPFSEEAFIDSIRKCMTVAKASGTDRVVINSGAKSERFLKARYPTLPQQAFVQYGNYIGETLTMAADLAIPNVTLGVMLGKAVKLAQGHLDTHSRKATMDLGFIHQLLREADCDIDTSGITLARELWEKIPSGQLSSFVNTIIRHCRRHCRPLLPHGNLTILLIDDDGNIYEPQP